MFVSSYDSKSHYDEMFEADGSCRPHYVQLLEMLTSLSVEKLEQLQFTTDKAQMAMGMTFNVYHDKQGIEKILYLDIVPRIINAAEWKKLKPG